MNEWYKIEGNMSGGDGNTSGGDNTTGGEEECIHTYGNWVVTKNATCVVEGTETSICSKCGDKKTRAIPATGSHTYGDYIVTTEPTCVVAGVKTAICLMPATFYGALELQWIYK